MKKVIFVLLIWLSNSYAAVDFRMPDIGRRIEANETGIPDYGTAITKGMQMGTLPNQLSQQLLQQQLQNQMLAMKLANYLATHPKIAKDMADRDTANEIVKNNTGFNSLFRSQKSYISKLRVCSKNGNKYCRNILQAELNKQQRHKAV